MRKLLVLIVLAGVFVVVPTAVASPTIRLAIVHVLHGCHGWDGGGPARTLTVKRGTKLEVRVNCSMSFDVVQLAGPSLGVEGRWMPGTSRTLRFAKAGVYKL